MKAYWQQARAIDDQHVLKEIAEQVGLDTENFETVMTDPTYDAEVSADIDLAREYRLDGVHLHSYFLTDTWLWAHSHMRC